MTDQITHRAFFGDAEHAFALTDEMLAELEQITGLGVGAMYLQLVQMAYPASVLREIIRLGLIGAGTAPEIAHRMVETYATNRPLSETFPLAFEVMEARWSGAQADKAAA
ncbi:gene transfer agent family protein [Ketogulonicigenium vulgare]|uniref:gene transfer agent family protein n=1 Tax=Ketogulonicigenium vulgare TaxID=92945 RepID=UPI0023596C12|nr:gene transfer agent family protein [Ketogulonicigenium vulgare]